MERIVWRRLAALGALLVVCTCAGCSANSPPLTKEEEKNFKGGPPPSNVNVGEFLKSRGAGPGAGGAPGAPANPSAPSPGQPQ